ncbi:MAG: zf-TFIIB domain-containing protein [Acidobacteria bacterium]|nr:zf-TFIIB domain-containing protein [Acidobacteriota bacterium]
MKCPKCNDANLMNVLGQLDFCPVCQGTWFDKGETAKYFSFEEDIPNLAIALSTAKKTSLSCPRCSGELEEIKYTENSDLLLDRCTGCNGLWFDAEEVDKLMQFANDQEDAVSRMKRLRQKLAEAGT